MTVDKHHEFSVVNKLIAEEPSIYTKILCDIASGKLASGERLVTTTLAKKYNTSINPVREALKQLQGEGFVTVLANSGSRVAKLEFHAVRDVFEILTLLEPYLIEWFMDEHTKEHLEYLKTLLNQMSQLTPSDFVRYQALEIEFHTFMYSQHYNKRAYSMWCKNKLMLQAFQANLGLSAKRFEQSVRELEQVLEGIETRNTEAVLATVTKHIQSSHLYWSKYLQ